MNYLKLQRLSLKLSQNTTSQHGLISRVGYQRLEAGCTTASPDQAAALQKLLGVPVLTDQHLINARQRRELCDFGPLQLERVNPEPWKRARRFWGLQGADDSTWDFLSTFVHADSATECKFHLGCIRGGAQAKVDSPLIWGYNRHLLLDLKGASLGARHWPCLLYRDQHTTLCYWPQLTLKSETTVYRIDGLLYYNGQWFILELDGQGHNSTFDETRSKMLGLPEIRFTSPELLKKDCFPLLLERLKALGNSPPQGE